MQNTSRFTKCATCSASWPLSRRRWAILGKLLGGFLRQQLPRLFGLQPFRIKKGVAQQVAVGGVGQVFQIDV